MIGKELSFTTQIGEQSITIKSGKLAQQAGGAVTIHAGESMLLATATMSGKPREGMSFFPLSVDFEEKLYAAGRIPGSFFKREGRPSPEGILICRLVDRPLRPLFPYGMRNEVQVIVTALSSDSMEYLDIMAVNGASAALTISNIPWNGPLGAVRVGIIDGEYVANATIEAMKESDLDLRMAVSAEAIIMVEAGGNEITEATMVEALAFGFEACQPFIATLVEMREAIGKEKTTVPLNSLDETVVDAVVAHLGDRLTTIVAENTDRKVRKELVGQLTNEVVEAFLAEDENADVSSIKGAISAQEKKIIRSRILTERVRPDGRDLTTVRELSSEITLLPRAHGSGLFTRGETQVLSIATLGMPREAKRLDGLFPEETRRYMHHYNFPPYSTGETWFLRGPKRREIGHGALAENALLPMIPSEEDFPYTIRVVSEALSSNGSTSQASVCGSSLALMDCGVPLKRPVGGIAMGLIHDDDSGNYAILTDIQGLEDHIGDMDFKVAGTTEGITAIQMDIKISGLSMDLLTEALAQALNARLEILASMDEAISAPRPQLSKYAPRMHTIKIDAEKIGAIIGKGGATVRSIQEEYKVSVDIQEDGTVFVAGLEGGDADAAVALIEQLAKGAEEGEKYEGKVVRITDFGCFVELAPGLEGMIHISQMSTERIGQVSDVVQMGDTIMCMVTKVDDSGKVRLSRQAILEGWTLEEAQAADQPNRGRGGGRGRNDRGGGRRGGGGGGRDRRRSRY